MFELMGKAFAFAKGNAIEGVAEKNPASPSTEMSGAERKINKIDRRCRVYLPMDRQTFSPEYIRSTSKKKGFEGNPLNP
jgi:hypothetical protein